MPYSLPTIVRFSSPVRFSSKADLLTQLGGVVDDVETGDRCGSAVGLEQRREDPHERRLARAVGAEQAEHGSARDVDVDVT
jgi:hypothetical protein